MHFIIHWCLPQCTWKTMQNHFCYCFLFSPDSKEVTDAKNYSMSFTLKKHKQLNHRRKRWIWKINSIMKIHRNSEFLICICMKSDSFRFNLYSRWIIRQSTIVVCCYASRVTLKTSGNFRRQIMESGRTVGSSDWKLIILFNSEQHLFAE